MRCVSEYGRISDLQEIARAVPDCRFLLAAAHRLPACAESKTVYAPYVPASNHGFFCGCMLYFSLFFLCHAEYEVSLWTTFSCSHPRDYRIGWFKAIYLILKRSVCYIRLSSDCVIHRYSCLFLRPDTVRLFSLSWCVILPLAPKCSLKGHNTS